LDENLEATVCTIGALLMENRNKNGMITTSVCVISNSGRASLAPTKIPNDVHYASSIQGNYSAIISSLNLMT